MLDWQTSRRATMRQTPEPRPDCAVGGKREVISTPFLHPRQASLIEADVASAMHAAERKAGHKGTIFAPENHKPTKPAEKSLGDRLIDALARTGGEARRKSEWSWRELGTSPHALGRTCERLQQAGLIEVIVKHDRGNRNGALLRLTDAGWQAAREAA